MVGVTRAASCPLSVRGTLGRVGGKLTITEPKTAGSRRTVPLSTPLVAMLRAHLAEQEGERAAARDTWTDHNLVFATEAGDSGRPAQYPADHPDRGLKGWHVRRRRAHLEAQRGGGVAGVSFTSRRCAICWDIRLSPSPATSTGTPATPPHAQPSTAWPINSASTTSEEPLLSALLSMPLGGIENVAADLPQSAPYLLLHRSG
jgi:hypothetical protein